LARAIEWSLGLTSHGSRSSVANEQRANLGWWRDTRFVSGRLLQLLLVSVLLHAMVVHELLQMVVQEQMAQILLLGECETLLRLCTDRSRRAATLIINQRIKNQ